MPCGRGLIDEEIARILLRIRVPGEYLDAFRSRLSQDRRNAGLILHADRDDVDSARDPTLNYFVLLGRVEIRGTVPQEFDVEFLRRLFRADAATHEVRVALGLRHHGYHRFLRSLAAAAGFSERTSHQLLPATISAPAMMTALSTAT